MSVVFQAIHGSVSFPIMLWAACHSPTSQIDDDVYR